MNRPESLYIHIPFCISKCSYCDFFSVTCGKTKVPDEYVQALCKEIIFKLKQFNVHTLKTIYIGGGTPSLLSKNQLNEIVASIKAAAALSDGYEFTIEVNPDDITEELLDDFESIGVTRISCGIQSMNKASLNYVGRRASYEQNINALQLMKNKWKGQLSVDVICGLPEETESSFILGLQKLLEFSPDHISMYSLTVEDETPLGKQVSKGALEIDYDFQDDLWLKGREFLRKNNYSHYEVSNFSKNGMECKHNLAYWKHKSYIGVGSGGCGTVYDDSGCGYRWTNKADINGYINCWKNDNFLNDDFIEAEEIEKDVSLFEFFMMGFRKLSGITDYEYYDVFKEKLPEDKIHIFNKWKKQNLLDITPEGSTIRYKLNDDGILLLNRFLEELL